MSAQVFFQLKHAKLQGAMQIVLLLLVVHAASGFTLEMPELPDLIGTVGQVTSLSWTFYTEDGGGTKGVPPQGLADREHVARRKHGPLSLVLLCLRLDFPLRYMCGKCHHGRWAHVEEQGICFLLRFRRVF